MTQIERKLRAKKIFDHSQKLKIDNTEYQKYLRTFILEPSYLDSKHDITVKPFRSFAKTATAIILSKDIGVLAGGDEIIWAAQQHGIKIQRLVADGTNIKPKQKLFILKSKITDLLSAERTLLNILQRMSGIASLTKQYVDLVGKYPLICATRKTICGWLDKKAVVLGGGYTHRLSLADGVLVKDNHLALLASLTELKKIYYAKQFVREIEISSLRQLKFFLQLNLDYDVIMLDNFSLQRLNQAMRFIRQNGYYKRYVFEISGGVNQTNIKAYAKTGVDAISVGDLTHSVKCLDLSLEIITHAN